MQKRNYKQIAEITREKLTPFIKKNKGVFKSNWECSCAVASFVLYEILKEFAYKANFAVGTFGGDSHSFVVLEKKIIIDITATQFHLPEVYICDFEDSGDDDYKIDFINEDAIQDIEKYWPDDQKPSSYIEELTEIKQSILLEVNNEKQLSKAS